MMKHWYDMAADLAGILLIALAWVSGLWLWLWIFDKIAARREHSKRP